MKSLFAFRLKGFIALALCFIVGLKWGVNAGAFCSVCVLTILSADLRPQHILGANSFDAAFVTDIAKDKAITILQTKLAALGLYSTKFTTDAVAPKKNILVPLVTGTDAVQVDPTNFETGGDTTAGKISVGVNHLFKNFHISFAELQQGYQLEQLLEINLRALANKIVDVAKTPLTVTNYGAALATVAAADFGTDDLIVLLAGAKNFDMLNLVLDGGHLARLMPVNKFSFQQNDAGAYGFDNMAKCNRWNGAGANVIGTIGSPAGLAVASGMPVIHNAIANHMLISEQIGIPDLGITVMFNVWGSLSARTVWGSYELMFGAAKGDVSTLKLITSA